MVLEVLLVVTVVTVAVVAVILVVGGRRQRGSAQARDLARAGEYDDAHPGEATDRATGKAAWTRLNF